MEIKVRPFCELDADELERLLELSLPSTPARRWRFRTWLTSPAPKDMYAAIVRVDGAIVGWAGASMGEGWNIGMIGAVVEEGCRGRGYARDAALVLVAELKCRHPEWPEYLCYDRGYERIFSDAVESGGFKDLWLHLEEYRERERRI